MPNEYTVNVRHRFNFAETPDLLYDKAYEVLSSLMPPWGLHGIVKKPLPQVKSNFMTGVSYTREVGRPVKSYSLGFQNRAHSKPPADLPMYDDVLLVVVRPKQLTPELVSSLLREALPRFVEAMRPYWMALEEDGLGVEDAREKLPEGGTKERVDFVDPRRGVNRIWPANYWDGELCRRAFNLTPEQVVQRLSSHVAEVRTINAGVLVIDSFDIPSDDAIRQIDARLRPLLSRR